MHKIKPDISLCVLGVLAIAMFFVSGCASGPETLVQPPLPPGLVTDDPSNPIIATVRLLAARPGYLAVHPDGTRVYVADTAPPARISVINVESLALEKTFSLGEDGALGGLAVSPDGELLYAALVTGGKGRLLSIDAENGGITSSVMVGQGPAGVAVSPDGAEVYVANHDSSTLSVVNLEYLDSVKTIPMGTSPLNVAVSRTGEYVYVTNTVNQTVTIVYPGSAHARRDINIGTTPWDIAVLPDNQTAIVSNFQGDSIMRVAAAAGRAEKKLRIIGAPCALAVKPDGSRIYVASAVGAGLTNIDAATNKILRTIQLPFSGGRHMAISPDGELLFVSDTYKAVHVIATAALEPQAEKPAQEKIIDKIVLSGVWFDFDKSLIKNEYIPAFEQVEALARRYPHSIILIDGHTCSMGSNEYNRGLSLRRAGSAYRELVRRGIAAERLTVRGFGESMPAMDNAYPEGRRYNRRVEFTIIERTGTEQ